MAQERKLTKIAVDAINDMKGVNLIGSSKAEDHEGIVTFTIDGVHPHDVASILDSQHIAVRAGHHCAQPLMDFLKVNSTTRASFAFYNTEEEVQHFIEELSKIRGLIGKPIDEAVHLSELFLKMIKDEATEEEIDELDEAGALRDISHMPARVKCAVLGWHTMEEMVENLKNV